MKRHLTTIFVLFFLLLKSYSQKITTIPFDELLGGIIMVKAKIATYNDTLHFILDSGSSHISIDSTTAAAMGIVVNKSNNMVNGIGGLRKANTSNPLNLHFPNLTLDSLIFNINDYNLLTESYGERIDGIIGFAFLSKYIFTVKFDSALINVYPRGFYKYPKGGYLWKFKLGRIPTTTLEITDQIKMQGNYYIDCGAGLCLLLNEDYVKDSNILKKNKKTVVTQVDGVGGKSLTRLTTVKLLKLGPYKFKNVPTYLYTDENDLLDYPNKVGLIGNDILRRFNWVLNYAKQEMYLSPNKFMREPFDYTYTGFSIYMIDGFITIQDIINNGPAQKAGLQSGDILMAINDAIITNIKKAKDMLQIATKKTKLIILRNQQLKTILLKPLRIK